MALPAPREPSRTEGPGLEPYLEHSEDGGGEGVKVGRWSLFFKVEPEENKKP